MPRKILVNILFSEKYYMIYFIYIIHKNIQPGITDRMSPVHELTNFVVLTCCLIGVSLKIVQLLQHFEHLVQPLAQAVETFVNAFGVKSIVSEVLR